MKKESNKSIVLEFYRSVIRDRNSELIHEYISDDYIQHSPSLKGGKAALFDAVECLKKMPKPAETKPPYILCIGDNAFVVLLLDIVFMGRKLVVDVFRMKDGKIVEHWDAMQDQRHDSPGHEVMLPVSDHDQLDRNKSLIRELFAQVGDPATKRYFARENYVEHNDEILNSGLRLEDYLSTKVPAEMLKVHRIFGEGNLVVVQSEGKRSGLPFVCYHFFKMSDGLIAEHWSVEQKIPDSMPHDNRMI